MSFHSSINQEHPPDPVRYKSVIAKMLLLGMHADESVQHQANAENALKSIRVGLMNDMVLFATTPNHLSQHKHLIDLYLHGTQQLERHRVELNDFFRAVCSANVQAHPSPQTEKAATQEIARLVSATTIPPLVAQPAIDSDLASEADLYNVLSTLQRSLVAAVDSLIRGFLTSLNTLCDEGLVGNISWSSNDLCRVMFPKRQAHQKSQTTHATSDGTQTDTIIQFQDVWYEHHMRRASVSHRLPKSSPKTAEEIWRSVPALLSQFAKVASGDIFKERECAKKDGLYTTIMEVTREDIDPAITLFDVFVLTAWKPKSAPALVPTSTSTSGDQAFPPSFSTAELKWLAVPALVASAICLFAPTKTSLALPFAFAAVLPWLSANRSCFRVTTAGAATIIAAISFALASIGLPQALLTQTSPTYAYANVLLCFLGAVSFGLAVSFTNSSRMNDGI